MAGTATTSSYVVVDVVVDVDVIGDGDGDGDGDVLPGLASPREGGIARLEVSPMCPVYFVTHVPGLDASSPSTTTSTSTSTSTLVVVGFGKMDRSADREYPLPA